LLGSSFKAGEIDSLAYIALCVFLYVDRTPPGLDAEIVSLVGVYDFARMNQVLIIYHVRSKNAAQPIVLDPNEIAAHRLVAPHRLQPWQVQ
jgi:hypothetical protein